MLPNVQKEEMEQGETGIKPTGMDIRSEEELGAAGEGFGHKGMTHNEKLSDWDPVDRIRMEEEFKTPPRKGDQRKWTGFQTDGSRDKIFDLGLVPDYVAAQSMSLTDQNQPGNTLSPVVNLEETVVRIKRDMEDTAYPGTGALGSSGGTDDHEGPLVQWFHKLGTISAGV